MFSPFQLKTFTTALLNGCGWYLDCDPSYTPPSEVAMRQGLQSLATAEVFVDEYDGLEEDTKQVAILK